MAYSPSIPRRCASLFLARHKNQGPHVLKQSRASAHIRELRGDGVWISFQVRKTGEPDATGTIRVAPGRFLRRLRLDSSQQY